MITQRRLDQIRLSPRPRGQLLMAELLLRPNYGWPLSPTRITLEGSEHVPRGGGAIFVMNHTDRYNYWPFQYQLYRQALGFTATWVKGKYYEHPLMARFMDFMNNIPIPSKGYLLTKDFQARRGRPPRDEEYAALKRFVDGELDPAAAAAAGGPDAAPLCSAAYRDDLEARFRAMMQRVVAINQQALTDGLSLLIFPQGTRSKRLTRGHTGAAQIALYTGAPVIPVGSNGADGCYPGDSPVSRGGRIVYRIGAPLTREGALRDLQITEPFVPFTDDATRHQAVFQRATDLFMARINDLLDEPYRFPPEADAPADSPEGRGASRFV